MKSLNKIELLNKLKNKYNDNWPPEIAEGFQKAVDIVEDAPTVDAIPVEWIKNYITPFQEFHDCLSEELKENDGAGWVVDILETMFEEWEKENE